MMSDEEKDRRENRRAEYAAAQASAEHLDSVAWTIKSILWSGNLVLMGFVLEQLAQQHHLGCSTRLLLSAVGLTGIATVVAACLWSVQCGNGARVKLQRCRDLESCLGMSQHRETDEIWMRGLGRTITYSMTGIFIAGWIVAIQFLWFL
jgi:hypothetical protein